MGDYSAEREQHEQLLVDYGLAIYEGRYEDAEGIRDTVVDNGWNSESDFDNYIYPSVQSGNPDNWLDSANTLADDTLEQRINNDIDNQIAESSEDEFFETDGSLGKKARELEAELILAAAATDDALTEALLDAQLRALQTGTGARGYDLAALATGEVDEWDFESQPENAARLRWASQCLLSSQMDELAKHHMDMHRGYSRVHMLGGVPGDEGQARLIVNKMFTRRDMSSFVEIKPFELSQVSPKIEVWKVAYDENLKYVDEVRLPFPAHSIFESERSVLESARSDFGISAVNWNFQGSNPDLVRNDIEAQVTFYFQGFDSLVKKHSDVGRMGRPIEWSYLDLLGFGHASLSREQLRRERPVYTSEPYEMKLILGYNTAVSTLNDVEDKARRDSLLASLEAQRMELYLTLIDHDIDVKDTGTIFIKCHFRARLEALLSDPRADVMSSGQDRAELERIAEALARARASATTNPEEISNVLEDHNEELDRLLNDRLTNIISAMESSGYLYNVHISTESMGRFAATGISPAGALTLPETETTGEYGSFVTGERERAESEIREDPKADPITSGTKDRLRYVKPTGTAAGEVPIHYFYFGDLVEILAEHAFSPGNLQNSELNEHVPKSYMESSITQKMKIILGPLEYERVLCSLPRSINLASVPISADAFVEFFYNKVVTARSTNFSLLKFMRMITQDLIISSLGDKCPGQKKSQKIGLNTMTIDAPQTQNGADPVTHLLEKQNKTTGASDKALRISFLDPIAVDQSQGVLWDPRTEKALSTTYSYLMLYTQQQIQASLTGNPDEDKKNGIHHLYIGQDRGLLKSISFAKTDQPHLREGRFQTVSDNPLYALSNVYNINVSMFGNNLFYPGVYLYLNPMGLGSELGDPSDRNSVARAMGIGGYHYVTNVSHKIEGGSYSTTVTALFESSGGGRSFCSDDLSAPGTRGGPLGMRSSGYGGN